MLQMVAETGRFNPMESVMKGLLVVAHGSRRPESNCEVSGMRDKLAERSDENEFERIGVAFIEKSPPTVEEVIAAWSAEGVTEVLLVPYLLAAGSHAVTDIPRAVAALHLKHPQLKVTVTPHIGAAHGMAGLIMQHVRDSVISR